ncbi:MAG: hypothetical protein ACTHM5_12200 [Ginsengibacter sp.]
MFGSGYPFHQIDKKKGVVPYHLYTWKFNFNTNRRRYIVEVELYELNIYIIKYFAACHIKSKNKYRLILNDEKPAKIIRTCIDIMLHFYKNDPLASFGFIGSDSSNKKKKNKTIKESPSNTQRFRIYSTLMSGFFGKQTFSHAKSKKYSAYLMINRKCKGIRQFKRKAELMFEDVYVNINFHS